MSENYIDNIISFLQDKSDKHCYCSHEGKCEWCTKLGESKETKGYIEVMEFFQGTSGGI